MRRLVLFVMLIMGLPLLVSESRAYEEIRVEKGGTLTGVVTLKGDELSVILNDETVVDKARVAQLPERGPIGLVNQGAPIQFANLYIKELP